MQFQIKNSILLIFEYQFLEELENENFLSKCKFLPVTVDYTSETSNFRFYHGSNDTVFLA